MNNLLSLQMQNVKSEIEILNISNTKNLRQEMVGYYEGWTLQQGHDRI